MLTNLNGGFDLAAASDGIHFVPLSLWFVNFFANFRGLKRLRLLDLRVETAPNINNP